MRIFAILVILASVLAAAATARDQDSWPPANHSRHVAAFVWTPADPDRGQTVHARATLQDAEDVTGVVLRVCRVENYACRSPFPMGATGASSTRPDYSVPVPWDPAFYRSVRTVGLAVVLEFQNGTTEESPLIPWPAPADLPEGAGTYYFYALPAEPASTSSLAAGIAISSIMGAVFLRRPT